MNGLGKHRLQIWNQNQHPFRHNLSDFTYTNAAIPNTSNVEEVLNWLIAVIYPNTKPAVATPAALPLVGNTISDYRVVQDDGDGKAASYRWEQREGEVAPSWHKVYDMDWGQDSILAAFLNITQDLYVYKYGKRDLDGNGDPLTGANAGQHVYGGDIANTHLTLHANSGDGVGAPTGFIQTENVRPLADATYSLSTLANRFVNLYLSGLLNVGNLSLTGAAITSDTGSVSFDNENLTTTGNITGNAINGTTAEIGSLNLGTNAITSDTNIISMLAQTVTGIAELVATQITVGTAIDFLKLTANGTRALYNASSNQHDFNAQNITNANQISMTTLAALNGQIANFVYLANDIANVNASTFTVPSMTFSAALASTTMTTTGLNKGATGEFGNVAIGATKITSVAGNSDIILSPNGTGEVTVEKTTRPSTNNTLDLGEPGSRFANLYLGTAVGDGTNTMPIATLMSLRDINVGVSTNMGIFWDGSKWAPSFTDTEVDHATIQGLTTGDAGHTQFAVLAGRSGGQQIQGGTGVAQDLTLESTSNASKGNIIFKDKLVPNTDAVTDIGLTNKRVKDFFASGENKGLRVENTATANNFNVGSIGRQYYNTTANQVYTDAGDHAKYPVYVDEYTETAAGSNQTLPFDIRTVANLTGVLSSISDISINSGYKGNRTKTLVNKTGAVVAINNSASIFTGTGENSSIPIDGSATFVYNGTAWYMTGSSGAGSGPSGSGGVINLIADGDADNTGTSIFIPYKDAAASRPVDGTGGTATFTTISTTSLPLAGTQSFIFTKPALNIQGEGGSIPFTVDQAYRAKSLKISVDYMVVSGTFVAGSATTDSDIIWYIYDVTNSQLIEPSNIKMFSNSSTIADKFEAEFQTSATGSNYRLIAHFATASTAAFVLKMDNVTVTPQNYVYGSVLSDWQTYTPTGSWTTNTTYAGKYKRIGDSMRVEVYITLAGAPTAANLTINVPFGLQIDTTKKAGSAGVSTTTNNFGTGKTYNNGSNVTDLTTNYVSATTVGIGYQSTSTGQIANVTATAPFTYAASMSINVEFEVPILGWTSGSRQSDGYDSRQIAFAGAGTGSTQALTASVTNISMTTVKDSTGSWTGSTFVVPSAGDYSVSAFLYATAIFTAQVHINGTFYKYLLYSVANSGGSGHMIVPNLKAGDIISIRSSGNITLAGDTAQNISIAKIQAPQTISASEVVAIRAKTAATRTTNNTFITIVYDSVDFDTHGAYNSTTGVFTAPIAGIYEVHNYMQVTSTATTINFLNSMYLFKNGSTYAQISGARANTTGGVQHIANGGTLIQLNAGDTLTFRAYTDTANTLLGNSDSNYFTIKRIK